MTKDQLLKTLDEMFLEADDGPRKIALDVAIELINDESSQITNFHVKFAHKAIIDNHDRS